MPLAIKWYCDGLVVYARVTGTLTIENLKELNAQVHRMVESSDAPLVHLVTDLSQITAYPSLGEAMRNVRFEERVGWSIVIGTNERKMVKFITSVIASALRLRFRQVNNLDEALDFLQKVDAALPNLHSFRQRVETGEMAEMVV